METGVHQNHKTNVIATTLKTKKSASWESAHSHAPVCVDVPALFKNGTKALCSEGAGIRSPYAAAGSRRSQIRPGPYFMLSKNETLG